MGIPLLKERFYRWELKTIVTVLAVLSFITAISMAIYHSYGWQAYRWSLYEPNSIWYHPHELIGAGPMKVTVILSCIHVVVSVLVLAGVRWNDGTLMKPYCIWSIILPCIIVFSSMLGPILAYMWIIYAYTVSFAWLVMVPIQLLFLWPVYSYMKLLETQQKVEAERMEENRQENDMLTEN